MRRQSSDNCYGSYPVSFLYFCISWTESYLSKCLVTQLIWHANPVRYITKKIVRSSPAGGGVLRLCSYLNFMLFTFNKQDIGLIFCCENRSSYEVDSWMRNR
ncbi:hypothetical protein GLOIN_2v677430 [Rhizophagus irregularis DAOM 181602=DAOM 197198]|uniref:Uncharacterized protein n=1 Tax=Rhizophagus irregularis (strain DAOM 197198w) TaxID=1432141 RepID=A0A015JDA2_RHIIW|nr:hypothetical protein RirG_114060 [Rhizophagus irregularis DAOM 197198w]GET64213.1 hypothetical protein GLOIN_2v677430 [Rhizophagus irregularis DAOM 181602=DAOM 197198]